MNYIIQNENLRAEFSGIGAELLSLKSKDGTEFIWQADSKYWDGSSPVLFPYCCRLYGGYYTYNGEEYAGDIHGFICRTEFSDVESGSDFIIFRKKSDEATKKLYPFDFIFEISYTLKESSLICAIRVTNTGNDSLYYCNGMHPGFNVPLEGKFEDWYLEFGDIAKPMRVLFSESKFCCGEKDFSYALTDGKRLALTHSLFDDEAIFLTDASRCVTIRSDISAHFVKVEYPDSPVIGFWQPEHTDAPFVCIEPLCGLPSFDGKIDDISTKMFSRRVGANESHTDTVTITVK